MTPTERFRVAGVLTPPRICHLVAPTLQRDRRQALAQYGQVDSEVSEWIDAIQLEAARYSTRANANGHGPPNRGASVRANDEGAEGADLLSANEVAESLECSASNVRYLARNGRLAAVRVKPYLFDPFEVEHYKLSRKET